MNHLIVASLLVVLLIVQDSESPLSMLKRKIVSGHRGPETQHRRGSPVGRRFMRRNLKVSEESAAREGNQEIEVAFTVRIRQKGSAAPQHETNTEANNEPLPGDGPLSDEMEQMAEESAANITLED